MSAVTLLDGPLGTELGARGVSTPLPGWSAHALETAPDVVRTIHADYARAGAAVHTTNTFRTRARVFPEGWRELARRAVALARAGLAEGGGAGRLVAGSIAPLEDCYRPDLSPAASDPAATRAEHAELAGELAAAGCDLLLCETFPRVDEALLALEAALATGRPVWLALTPGPDAALLTPDELARGARTAVRAGATAVLVNCAPPVATERYVATLADALGGDVPFGAYANAGRPDDAIGWVPGAVDGERSGDVEAGAARYAELAARWVARGATLVGGCCGTACAHVRALARAFGDQASGS